ncbi:hypothetical protein GIB67_015628, partial [Kingdonia uniflora]
KRTNAFDNYIRSRIQHDVDWQYNAIESDEDGHVNVNKEHMHLGHYFLGQMDVKCTHCYASHLRDERLSHSSIANLRFGQCCLQGKIRLPNLDPFSNEFKELYEGNNPNLRSFWKYIREYNSSNNAFTSLGVHMGDRVIHGRGPSFFVIHRELHHRIRALSSNQGHEAMYAQLYIYNPGTTLNTCHKRNLRLLREVLRIIADILFQNNHFYGLYRIAYEVLEGTAREDENFNVPAYLYYSTLIDRRRYNYPTTNEITLKLPEDGS